MLIRPTPAFGASLGVATTLGAAALDQQQPDAALPDPRLYVESWTLALLNLLVVGPTFYRLLAKRLCGPTASVATTLLQATTLVVVHSGLYAIVHRAMHRLAALRPIHRHHHRHMHRVVPSSANAVSVAEFLLAYMAPFAIGGALVAPSLWALAVASTTVSVFNLLVHSPALREAGWPMWLVHPVEHLDHHAKRTPTYSAPTLHWGNAWGRLVHDVRRCVGGIGRCVRRYIA